MTAFDGLAARAILEANAVVEADPTADWREAYDRSIQDQVDELIAEEQYSS